MGFGTKVKAKPIDKGVEPKEIITKKEGKVMNDIAIFCNGLMLIVNGLEYIADTQSIHMTRNNNYAGIIYLREGKLKYTNTSIYGVKCYDLVKI